MSGRPVPDDAAPTARTPTPGWPVALLVAIGVAGCAGKDKGGDKAKRGASSTKATWAKRCDAWWRWWRGERKRDADLRHLRAPCAKACAAKHAPSCAAAGEMWLRGNGGPVDPRRAEAAFRQGCRLASSVCERLAGHYRTGALGAADPTLARRYYTEACFGRLDRGPRAGAQSCRRALALWRTGKPGATAAAEIRRLRTRACQLGDAEVCAAAAHMWRCGRGGPANPGLAKVLRQRGGARAKGPPTACDKRPGK